jgi:hypothetical protein
MQLFRSLRDYPTDKLMVLGPSPTPNAQTLNCTYQPLHLLSERATRTRLNTQAITLNCLGLFPDFHLRSSVSRVISFSPQLVVTVMDRLSYYQHAWKLSRKLNCSFMTITMDDPETFETPYKWAENPYIRLLKNIYQSASLSIGVSNEMSKHLGQRYCKPTQTLYFGPPDGLQLRAPEESAHRKNTKHFILGYAGTLGLGYRSGIQNLLPALEATGTRLHVYTGSQHRIPEHPSIINRGFVPVDALWDIVKHECDAVLLPYSFEPKDMRIYKTHFPTKLSEYSWTGMPLLIVGPSDATGVRWGQQHQESCITIDQKDHPMLSNELENLAADSIKRTALARSISKIAKQEFSPDRARSQFVQYLREAASCAS